MPVYLRKWQRQPPPGAVADAGGHNLAELWASDASGLTGVMGTGPVALQAGASMRQTERGLALYCPTTLQFAIAGGEAVHAPSGSPWSFAAWCRLQTFGGASRYKLLALLRSDTASPFSIFASNAGAYFGWNIGSFNTWARSRTNAAVSIGEWMHVGVSYNGTGASDAANFGFFLNGARQSLVSSSTFSSSTQRTQFSGNVANQQFEGDILAPAVASVAWTDEQFRELYENHWRLFKPHRVWVPQAAITGLPTLSLPTYVPGSLTATGFRPRVTAT